MNGVGGLCLNYNINIEFHDVFLALKIQHVGFTGCKTQIEKVLLDG